jgi:hypothetical protein
MWRNFKIHGRRSTAAAQLGRRLPGKASWYSTHSLYGVSGKHRILGTAASYADIALLRAPRVLWVRGALSAVLLAALGAYACNAEGNLIAYERPSAVRVDARTVAIIGAVTAAECLVAGLGDSRNPSWASEDFVVPPE